MDILNLTPFVAEWNAGWDHTRLEHYVVVLCATFQAKPGGAIRPTEEAGVLRSVDEYHGEPGQSSVRFEADFAPEKPKVDVLVNGHAYSPRGRKIERVKIAMRVGDLYKELVVTGDRHRRAIFGASPPQPFHMMPLVYERAYGGSDIERQRTDVRNPIGVGYGGAKSIEPSVQTDLPNIEYSDGRSEPAGFGVVARHWQPRLKLAGTYNDSWLRTRWPFLPQDFDPAHYQAAPADQQSETIHGGELVELLNMTPDGVWRFRLPTLDVPLRLWYADRGETATLRLDTVLLEPDDYRVTLTARARIPIVRNRAPLREAILGHITRGWWRARLTGKAHIDHRGLNGKRLDKTGYVE